MKKIITKIKSSAIVKNDGKNFLHFFLAFTVIFVALTVIIIQVMQLGIYRATDQNLRDLSQNQSFLEDSANSFLGSYNRPAHGDFGPNNPVIFYDVNGKRITSASSQNMDYTMSDLEKAVKFNENQLNSIHTVSVSNPYGKDWHYRYLATRFVLTNVDGSITPVYVQIFTNVDQIQDAMSRAVLVIITTMITFWLLSVIISLYLANWTLKPILSAYEKQKEFVENASHELRTPLAILQNRLELLFQTPTATIIDASENISESLAEVRNMRLLTTTLLHLARSESGIKINPVATQLDYFEKIFESYEMLAENAGKIFKGNLKIEGTFNLDQALFKQLMTILFDNALKYTDENGEIFVDVQKNGNNLLLAVADNGEGISDEDKKKIFDRFFRVDKARTRQKGGLGLGLSLAKQIVDAYNGKISVEDNKPHGTKFVVKLRLDGPISSPAKIFQKL
ncbi:sensor histidine kinase [Lactococcus kimchii]|uniref:sensor histidine kinase n=1 Tax=Lactococcus sp. S-13 TaxID=2507158 RepID=UPI0010235F9D|nr:HAMP domain-containing sensor histidine kinase [Lactococcus sp. S-13]RZI48900.1 HAMP domain-containing histidine kinase [Lactococcus sp. S-13]